MRFVGKTSYRLANRVPASGPKMTIWPLLSFSLPPHCQWDLVCDRSFLPELSMMIFGIGGMLGECVGNMISDKFGRKWVHITGFVVIIIFGSATAFSKNFDTYIALVFFSSLANAVSIYIYRKCSLKFVFVDVTVVYDIHCTGSIGCNVEMFSIFDCLSMTR